MKFLFKLFLTATVCCLLCATAYAQRPQAPLTNASVVKLVRAGFREKTVIAIINSRPVSFDLSPDRLIELKKGGVPERVILAMLARAESLDFAGDEWDDELPLGGFGRAGRPGSSGAGAPPASDPGEVNIFGSAGG